MTKYEPYMKRHSIICTALAVICAISSSCGSIQVATDVIKMYPMTCFVYQVKVYEGNESPANYEHLGTVAVYDPGMSRVTPYETTMDLAKRAVCEAGGNALYISRYEAPNSLVSTNHQLIGQILLDTGDKKASNEGPAGSIAVNKELKDYVESRYVVSDGQQVINGNNFYAGIGFGHMFAETELMEDSAKVTDGSVRNGLSYILGYEHIFPDGRWGIGAFCSCYTSSVKADIKANVTIKDAEININTTRYFEGRYRVNLHLAGPSISYSKTNDHLYCNAHAGLGCAWQTESFAFSSIVYGAGIDSEKGVMKGNVYHGFGFMLGGEVGYRVNNLFTFGVALNATEYAIIYDSVSTLSLNFLPVISICPTLRLTL